VRLDRIIPALPTCASWAVRTSAPAFLSLLNPEPATVRKIGLITGGPNPHQMLACLAYLARLAPSAHRDHRTHAIARNEADATAKEEQERLLHIPFPPAWPTSLLATGASQCALQYAAEVYALFRSSHGQDYSVFPTISPTRKAYAGSVPGKGVPYVESRRRVRHHDRWACRLCRFLRYGLAMVGLTETDAACWQAEKWLAIGISLECSPGF
jgi:hypothetical protein